MPDWSVVDLLPGLWVAALVLVLAAVLRRWYDPVPGAVLAAFGLAVALLFGGALFGGGLLLPLDGLRGQPPFRSLPPTQPHGNILQGDLIELITPSRVAVQRALGEGRWPLWCSWEGAGMPLLADPQAQAFQPLVLLSWPMTIERGAAVTAALRVLVALIFAFLWMRRQGLGAGPALAGSFAYGLGGFVVLWAGWPLANPAALLPFVLYAVALYEQRGWRRDCVLLAAALAALLLGGHPETIVYALALAALFFLDGIRRRPAGARWPLARGAALALVVAAAVTAPVLLPAAELLPHSLRAARMSAPAAEHPAPAGGLAARWLPIAAPNAYGNSRFAGYWGLSNTNEDASGFVGTVTLLAALLAIGAQRRFPGEGLALVVAGLCLAALALPAFVTLSDALASRRVLLPFALCASYLAACTLERFARGEIRRWPALAVAAGLGVLIVWGILAHPDPADPQRLAILRIGWLRWHLRFLALGTLLLMLPRSGWMRRAAVTALALAIAAELLLAHGPANPPAPKRLAFPATAPVRFLRRQMVQDPRAWRMAALGRAFPPNLASLYGLTDARLYNPMAPKAYMDALKPILAGWWGELPELGAPGDPLYSRLAVRYLLTAPGQRLPPPWRLAFANSDGWIYENRNALPRLFAAGGGRKALSVQRLRDEWIVAQVRSGPALQLASSVYQDGGWRLLVDGRAHPAGTLDGPFVGSLLPEGARRLDLLYRPRVFLLGCLLAPLGLVLGATLWIRPPAP